MVGAMAPVAEVLRSRHVPRLLAASLLGRLPIGMAPLAVALAVRAQGGDYRLVGALTARYAASAAVGGPVLGRLIDRSRQPPVLLACAAFVALGYLPLGRTPRLLVLDLAPPVAAFVLATAVAAVGAALAAPRLVR